MLQNLSVRASVEAESAMGNERSGGNVISTWNCTVVEEKQDGMIEEEVIDIPCLYPFPFLCRVHLSEPEVVANVIEVGNAPDLFLALVRVHDPVEEAEEAACHVDEGSCFVFHCLLCMDRAGLQSGLVLLWAQ